MIHMEFHARNLKEESDPLYRRRKKTPSSRAEFELKLKHLRSQSLSHVEYDRT